MKFLFLCSLGLLLLFDGVIFKFKKVDQEVTPLLDVLDAFGFEVPVEHEPRRGPDFILKELPVPIPVFIQHVAEKLVFLKEVAIVDVHKVGFLLLRGVKGLVQVVGDADVIDADLVVCWVGLVESFPYPAEFGVDYGVNSFQFVYFSLSFLDPFNIFSPIFYQVMIIPEDL
jgi:hypothetical protein